MPKVAYLANKFPSPVEPYVGQEIWELRRRGVQVVLCSVRCADALPPELGLLASETVYLQVPRLKQMARATWLFFYKFALLKSLLDRAVLRGKERLRTRLFALLHTWLGVYYALLLEPYGVEHIHAHHGYFGSWIAMVAARVLGIDFSMTLHGSDLLLRGAYLDLKLESCKFCFTVSKYNRRHILEHYPKVAPSKVVLQHMGVDLCEELLPSRARKDFGRMTMLAVGRLHPVKDHSFLLRACRLLKDRGFDFQCVIAGEGSERCSLERLIRDLNLESEVRLVGLLSGSQLETAYAVADLVVLTSRSEGIPLVLMEAMARGKPVLAPDITGIPELIVDGKTGFLYSAGSLDDFVERVILVRDSQSVLGPLLRAARLHVLQSFNRATNLAAFCDFFISHLHPSAEFHENPILQ